MPVSDSIKWPIALEMSIINPCNKTWVSISLAIPLIDWGVRKGKYNMARNNLNIVKISSRQDEVSMEEEVIMTVNDFNIQQSLIVECGRGTRPLDIGL